MKQAKLTASLLFLSAGLSIQSAAYAEIINGGLQNLGNTPPSAIKLNLVYITMGGTMALIADYVEKNNQCPPAEYFKDSLNNVLSISNGSACDVVVQFGSDVPGPLQYKIIRMVVKNTGTAPPSPAEFGIRQIITDIDYGSNGVDQVFLLNQAPAYFWSHTLQGSSFGNAASVPTSLVLQDSYDTIVAKTKAVNAVSSPGSQNKASKNYTIG